MYESNLSQSSAMYATVLMMIYGDFEHQYLLLNGMLCMFNPIPGRVKKYQKAAGRGEIHPLLYSRHCGA